MRNAILALMLVPFVALVLACGDNGRTSDVTTTTATNEPTGEATPTSTRAGSDTGTPAPEPGLFIVEVPTGDGTQATPGTRCWGGSCVDYVGPITKDEPISFAAGVDLGWQVEGGTADEVAHVWIAKADAATEPGGDGTLVWRLDSFDFDGGDAISVPEEPGEYLLAIFIRYTSGDDVLWGLYVKAE